MREAGAGWMKVSYDPPHGDALELHHSLVPDNLEMLKFENIIRDGSMFRRLLPKDNWKLDNWLKDGSNVRDYALILRHTEQTDRGRRQKFMLAGFTERGTAAAGAYLAQKWEELFNSYVDKDYNERGCGDFLLLIEGPSDYKDKHDKDWIKKWIKDWHPAMRAVTPALLDSIGLTNTPWAERFRNDGPNSFPLPIPSASSPARSSAHSHGRARRSSRRLSSLPRRSRRSPHAQ